MKIFKKSLIALCLSPLFSLAQANYKPGYVVTLKGDTLQGFIDYKEWIKNPKYFSFRSTVTNDKAGNFSSKNATAFAVTGLEYYQRFIVPISQDNVDIDHLGQKSDSTYLTDTVFLRVMVKGKYLTLFRYNDDIKSRFYILEAGDTDPRELIYHVGYNPEESGSVVYIARYRIQLENLAQKYAANNGKINNQILVSKYNEDELMKIIQIINGTSSQQFTAQSLPGIRWFAGGGINYNSLKYTVDPIAGVSPGSVSNSSSIFPKITAGLDFFLNKHTQQLFLRADLSFTSNRYNILNINSTTGITSTSTLSFTQYTSSITPQIICNIYNKEQLKLFVGAGAAINVSFYTQKKYTQSYGSSFPTYQNNFPETELPWISFPIKAGVQLNKKIEISICYIPPSNIINELITSASVSSFQVGVNYLFGK